MILPEDAASQMVLSLFSDFWRPADINRRCNCPSTASTDQGRSAKGNVYNVHTNQFLISVSFFIDGASAT